MGVLFWIVVYILLLLLWLIISRVIFLKFQNSRGVSSLFWFALWMVTLSFIFSGSSSASSSNKESLVQGGDDCIYFSSDDCDDYDSCNSWDDDD